MKTPRPHGLSCASCACCSVKFGRSKSWRKAIGSTDARESWRVNQLDQLRAMSGSTWEAPAKRVQSAVAHGLGRAPLSHGFIVKKKTSKRQAGTPSLLRVATKVDIHLQKRQCFTHPSESKSEGWKDTATLLPDLIPKATKQPGQWFAQEVRWWQWGLCGSLHQNEWVQKGGVESLMNVSVLVFLLVILSIFYILHRDTGLAPTFQLQALCHHVLMHSSCSFNKF